MQLMTVTLRLYPVDTIISYSQQLTIEQKVAGFAPTPLILA